MKLFKLTPKKNTAQAMVEFAIVLPLLLLLLYGLLEAGRLLFMYSTIVTASRQAARYGSATGSGNGGILGTDIGKPRYQDCDGIRAAANRQDFLNAFDHTSTDILIQWDTGPGTTATPFCPVGTAIDESFKPTDNLHRIQVTVLGDFTAIVPNIVPFFNRTITGRSARTIITGVSIEVTPPPGSGGGSSGPLLLTVTANPNSYTAAGQLIQYTFTITNNDPTNSITGPFIITGVPFAVDCSAATSPLAAGASTSCAIVDYYTTQTDVDPPGYFEFTAVATGTDSDGNPVSDDYLSKITLATVTASLTLSVTPAPAIYTSVGEVITYNYTVTNGPIPVGPVVITDDKAGSITCAATALDANATTTCSGSYAVTQTDIDAGIIVNSATASASPDGGTTTTTSGPAGSTATLAVPRLSLTKSVTPLTSIVDGIVTYNFTLTNSGNVPLSTVGISDPLLGGAVAGCSTANLDPGGQITCAATYVVRSADVSSNGNIINTAVASATFGSTPVQSQSTATLTISSGSLFLEVYVTPTTITQPNQTITYTYKLTNGTTKNLEGPYVLGGSLGSALNNCFTGTLASGSSQSCNGSYLVSQTLFDAGTPIENSNITVTACESNSNCNGNKKVTSNTVTATPVTISGQSPGLSFQVTVSPALATSLGQQVVYTYRLTNSGNVTLKPTFTVTDPKFGNITCSTGDILPGAFKDCTKPYNVTQADIDAGSIPGRQATASATYNAQTISATAPVPSVTTFQGARLKLELRANPTTYPEVGQSIIFTYILTNTGTVPLGRPYSIIEDSLGTGASCESATQTLMAGQSTTCGGSATVSGPPGSKVVLTARARANAGTQPIDSNSASVTVTNPILACNTVVANATSFTKSGSSMSMSVYNPLAVALQIKNITVSWNHNNGHNDKKNETLNLQSLKIGGGSNLSTGTQNGPSYTFTPSTAQFIPASTPATVFTFNFSQSYDIWEAGPEAPETVTITLATPGCESVAITLVRP